MWGRGYNGLNGVAIEVEENKNARETRVVDNEMESEEQQKSIAIRRDEDEMVQYKAERIRAVRVRCGGGGGSMRGGERLKPLESG
jgi:hypothetical protein